MATPAIGCGLLQQARAVQRRGRAPRGAPKVVRSFGDVEAVPKTDVLAFLLAATKACKTKRPHSEGARSFEIPARVDPARVAAASPRAGRFVAAPWAAP